jgi:hypothetical protein
LRGAPRRFCILLRAKLFRKPESPCEIIALACGESKARKDADDFNHLWKADTVQTTSKCLLTLALAATLAASAALAAGTARADDYPSRPIKLIVPYAAGGVAD